LDEAELIARYFAPLAGPGGLGLRDDAALLATPPGAEIVLTADALVAGVHFFDADPPERVAAKALAVNLSDLAAKGAEPLGFLLTLALPGDWTPDWLERFARGLGDAARLHLCPLLGGDTVATPGPLSLSITALGSTPAGRMIPRTGARAGDVLHVSGTIGDAALGLALRRAELGQGPEPAWAAALAPQQRDHLVGRYLAPQPRLGLRTALRACASAAMDVSDGLIGDLRAMMRASGTSARFDLRDTPLSEAAAAALRADPGALEQVVCGGDDYEILCATPPEKADLFAALAAQAGVAVRRIGTVAQVPNDNLFLGFEGEPLAFRRDRFSHF
jgi:thiamine-monophosphate kinase